MIWVIFASLIIALINWVILKEIRTDWIYYPGSRQEQYFWLFLLGVFDILSVGFLWFVAKKIKNVFEIFISTVLVFFSLCALHDIIFGFRKEPLIQEFLMIGVTLIWFLWLRKRGKSI